MPRIHICVHTGRVFLAAPTKSVSCLVGIFCISVDKLQAFMSLHGCIASSGLNMQHSGGAVAQMAHLSKESELIAMPITAPPPYEDFGTGTLCSFQPLNHDV
jgi:hypothetical protein